jgi:hypothetical protein
MSNSQSLVGVEVLSKLILGNYTDPEPAFVADEFQDYNNYLILGLPFLFVWIVGIGFSSYHTDDDGYVTGARRVESEFLWYRVFSTFMSYVIEGVQVIACAFGPAATSQLKFGDDIRSVLQIWLFRGGDFYAAFAGVATVQVIMVVAMLVPTLLYRTLERELYHRFAAYYVYGPFGTFIAFVQDCFMFYLPIPFMIILLMPVTCVYYATGEPASANEGTALCGSEEHTTYAIVGGVIASIAFMMGMVVGTVPVLVERNTDIALNGRFTSVSFAFKCAMACVYVLFSDRHEFYHVGGIFFLQLSLIFLNLSLRPCLVERINFHRSAVYIIALVPSSMSLLASILRNPVNVLPFAAGLAAVIVLGGFLVLKYFALPCGKLFPAIDFEEGAYEGGICLGLSIPHGHGIIRWEEESKMFAGTFLFGKYHGYGVFTQYKFFFQGEHYLGLREGFGVTNIMIDDAEESYEGVWRADMHHGNGTKKFKDNDVYEGVFTENMENGDGEWSFDTALGRHVARGIFEFGAFTNVRLEEHEEYDGDLRYGVPHGLGKMIVYDDVFEGEWRAGKLHGHGTVRIEAGEYEGLFIEGNFNDEGTWRDDQETYTGRWKDGLKHGMGVQELESGTYEGQFDMGERHGYGTFTYSDGTMYQGSWQHNDYHGAGLLKTSDGAEYDGNWIEGRRHGTRGTITFPSEESYIGGWQEDEYHDHGILKVPNMGEYTGKFEFGKRHGLGRFTFNDGTEFIGDWQEDFACGEGHFVFTSRKAVMVLQIMSVDDASLLQSTGERYFLDYGGVYDGFFEKGAMHGTGTSQTGDGTVYKGDWGEGLPHGNGTLSYPGGGEFEGDFYAGLRDGIGTMTYADERLYRGSWESGKRHGHGALFSATGDILHDCEWVMDVPNDGSAIKIEPIVVPEVDVDELLRAIMPAASSKEEIEELRGRKRLELEEIHEKGALQVFLEEELMMRRIVKSYVGALERGPRRAMEEEERRSGAQAAKPLLAKLLNAWKVEFRTYYDREPKKSDIMHDETIAPVYRRYQEIVKQDK